MPYVRGETLRTRLERERQLPVRMTRPGVPRPLRHISWDTAQQYFSAGMTEEIATHLSRVAALRMLGRVAQYDMAGDGLQLGVRGWRFDAFRLLESGCRGSHCRSRPE